MEMSRRTWDEAYSALTTSEMPAPDKVSGIAGDSTGELVVIFLGVKSAYIE